MAIKQSERINVELGQSGYYIALKRKFILFNPVMDDLLNRISQGRFEVLDVGMGPALITERLLEGTENRCSFVGVDIEEKWSGYVAELISRWGNRLKFIINASNNLPFRDGSFNMVVSVNSLHHFKYPEVMIHEMLRVLRESGICVIYDYNPASFKLKLLRYILTIKGYIVRNSASRAFLDSINSSYSSSFLKEMFLDAGIGKYSISKKGIFNIVILAK
ncbi:MAG: class I SAM-dependent methyltransferase [Candidatus Omnitrophica bacterium]|nr:class I SAM-dependent methyltransferase [Candidatus Omnitrophota bacterium]MBU1869941.1 class I SAM-dependent methyltransferase [Candidatus Omnitrophota bacterium]